MSSQRVLNRCSKCGREVEIFLPKARTRIRIWLENSKTAECNECNPKSRWKVVKGVRR